MSHELFCADTYSVNRISNSNSVKSMAAPIFSAAMFRVLPMHLRVLRNGKEIVSKSKGILYLELFICLYFGAVKTYLVSLTAWLMSFFQPCLLLFCFSFCETPLWIYSVIVEKSGYRSLAASNWKWKNLQNWAHEKEWESFLISKSNLFLNTCLSN